MIPIVVYPSILEDDLANQFVYPQYHLRTTTSVASIVPWRARKLETTDTLIKLSHIANITTSADKSLHDFSDDSTAYTVTAGKTGDLVLIADITAGTQFKVWQTDAADDIVTGSPVTKYTYTGTPTLTNSLITVDVDDNGDPLTFAAGKYITIEITSVGDTIAVLSAHVIES